MRRLCLFPLVFGCALATHAWAQSPLVAELDVLATRYHENPVRLDAPRDHLEQRRHVGIRIPTF